MTSQSNGIRRQKPRHISLMIKTGSSPYDWECYQGELSELKEKIAFVVLDKNIGSAGKGYGKLAVEDEEGHFGQERDVEFFWSRTEMGHTCVGLLLGSKKKDTKSKPILTSVVSNKGIPKQE
jgi:hypothetical protein